MLRAFIRHLQPFAWLMILTTMAGGAFAQARERKAIATERPAGVKTLAVSPDLRMKRVERVAEPGQARGQHGPNQEIVRRKIAVGEKTGAGSKQEAQGKTRDSGRLENTDPKRLRRARDGGEGVLVPATDGKTRVVRTVPTKKEKKEKKELADEKRLDSTNTGFIRRKNN